MQKWMLGLILGLSIAVAAYGDEKGDEKDDQAAAIARSADGVCGITLQPTPDKQVVALWRQTFDGGARDLAIARIGKQGPIVSHRATFGGVAMGDCSQPALARGGDWGWHMAWFGAGDRAGVFYARMDGDAWVSSPPKRFAATQAAQPSLLALGEHVWLAWKQGNEQGATVNIAVSDDGGRSWADPIVAAQAAGVSGEPTLLNRGGQAYLLWNTAAGPKELQLPQ